VAAYAIALILIVGGGMIHRKAREPAPAAIPYAAPPEPMEPAAREALDATCGDWIGITDAGRFVGWMQRGALVGEGPVDGCDVHDAAVRLDPEASLRSVLDAIVTASTEAAVIEKDGRFIGLVSLSDIRHALGSDTT
jgi:CBS domain-containing protein